VRPGLLRLLPARALCVMVRDGLREVLGCEREDVPRTRAAGTGRLHRLIELAAIEMEPLAPGTEIDAHGTDQLFLEGAGTCRAVKDLRWTGSTLAVLLSARSSASTESR